METPNYLRNSLGWLIIASVLLGTLTFVRQVGADGGDTTLIHACLTPAGTVRIVGANTGCLPAETPLHWPTVAKVDAITEPQVFTVNCPGDSVADALAQATTLGPVTINIAGICPESVTIDRDDVVLQGISLGDGLQAPSPDSVVLRLERGARRIELRELSISGGVFGVFVADGSALLSNATVENAGVFGVAVGPGGSLDIRGGLISNNGAGVDVSGGKASLGDGVVVRNSPFGNVRVSNAGTVSVSGATIESGGSGVVALHGGAVELSPATVVRDNNGDGIVARAGTVSISGSLIANNTDNGVLGVEGGRIELAGAIVEGNGGSGVDLRVGSSLRIHDGAIVRANTAHGIRIGDVSVATLGDPNLPLPQITDNAGWGIFCDPAPAVAQIAGGTVAFSNNGAGDENCPGL